MARSTIMNKWINGTAAKYSGTLATKLLDRCPGISAEDPLEDFHCGFLVANLDNTCHANQRMCPSVTHTIRVYVERPEYRKSAGYHRSYTCE